MEARAYFHGGLSPQELIIPVVVMRSAAKFSGPPERHSVVTNPGHGETDHKVLFGPDRRKPERASLFGFEPPKVRVELRANKKCVSVPVSASYGFEDATGEVKLRIAENDHKQIEPNTVTVMLSRRIHRRR